MKASAPSRVLVVAAHPDDEVLGCGATMARLADAGARVEILILGEGLTSRTAPVTPADLEALRDAARRAAAVLGAAEPAFGGFPDNRLDAVPLLDVVRAVEERIAAVDPEVVFTHHPGDLNVDHRIAFSAALTATRPVPGCGVRALYAFEVASSTEWAFSRYEPAFRPNVFVDAAGYLERKIAGLAAYDGEIRAFPHPRSAGALEAQARRWGSVVGRPAAEAFELVRAFGEGLP